jgi:hypothetical protein
VLVTVIASLGPTGATRRIDEPNPDKTKARQLIAPAAWGAGRLMFSAQITLAMPKAIISSKPTRKSKRANNNPVSTKNMTTLQLRKSIARSPSGQSFLLIPLLLTCFAFMPMAQAVGPDTDGAIAGANNGEGIGVLVSRTGGVWNTGTGFEALNHLTAGNQNTATGLRALFSDTNGGFNTATGVFSVFSNTSGFFNSATGAYSLANNTIGNSNTANGYSALYRNTEGEQNTATGFAALYRNTEGNANTANGSQALFSNTTGNSNTANGQRALSSNTTGAANTANGLVALFSNTTGNFNTAAGISALQNNTTGGSNTALGFGAGFNVTTANNVIAIGSNVVGENVSNTCYIGNIFGVTSAAATGVVVNSLGKLGTIVSSRRFKDDIKPMDQASEVVLALKPVTFHYKKDIDPQSIPQFGLVAEDVEEINPDLVVRDAEGKVNTVRYEAINAMLLNEFLKEHRKVEKLEATVAQQEKEFHATIARHEKEISVLTAQLKEQAAQIQKVTHLRRVEAKNPAPQMVLNNP